jgi:hypothetical protein
MDGEAELRDAGHLWGLENKETESRPGTTPKLCALKLSKVRSY